MSSAQELEEEEIIALESIDVEECLTDLLPRAFRARTYFKNTGPELHELIRFAQLAEMKDYHELRLAYIEEIVMPLIMRAEALQDRARNSTSEYVGTPGEAIELEIAIVFVKSWEDPMFGTKYVTIAEDENGNSVKYWGAYNIFDPIDAEVQKLELNPDVMPADYGKRKAQKGDHIKLRASVSHHEPYQGVKGTFIKRPRKILLTKRHE